MNEIDIFRALVEIAPPLVALRNGGQPLGLVLAYQPTQQGAPTVPTATMHVVGSKRYGWPRRAAKWDESAGVMLQTELQAMETTLQITMRAKLTPDPAAPTETDRLQIVVDTMQSDAFMRALRGKGAQVLRVTDVRQGRFIDDGGQNANWPSFDIVIKHTRQYIEGAPVVAEFDGLYIYAVV